MVCCLLCVDGCVSFGVICLLIGVCGLLFVFVGICCLLLFVVECLDDPCSLLSVVVLVVCCELCVDRCLSFVVGCSLFVGRSFLLSVVARCSIIYDCGSSLFVVCCLLFVVG